MSGLPAGETTPSGLRYVLTLCTASVPMPIKLSAGLVFPGLSVFRSRTVEDGRERFRLHLGYFGSAADAEAVLVSVRPYYPSALVGRVPAQASGSLDDTINTAFTLVRGAAARLVTPDELPPATTGPSPPVASAAPAPTLTPHEVARVMAPQRYAVQLDWSLKPVEPAAVPRLGIFRAYSLYAVSVLRQGSPEHGLRLGFFKNLEGARQVADYVRDAFPCASIVPVSYREYCRASELARPQGASAPARAVGALEVIEEASTPPAATNLAPQPVAPAPPGPVADAGRSGEARTRDELLALLGAHDLEVARERDARVTLTAEERALLLNRPERNVRSW